MRQAVTVDRKYATFTDHWIRRDIDLTTRDVRTDFTIEPILTEAYDALPPGERAYYLARAYSMRALELPPGKRPPLQQRAERAFMEAIDLGFDTAESWFFLGKVQLERGGWADALACFTEALDRDPGSHDIALAYGQALAALRRLDEAAVVFRAMLERDPDDPMARAEHGRTLWELGRFDEARAAYETAIAKEPWSSTLWLNLGMVDASLRRFDRAAEAGLRAVTVDPDNPAPWSLYEKALEHAGRPAEAAVARRR
jgi:tetratricopeptide (TPR) repeat protein